MQQVHKKVVGACLVTCTVWPAVTLADCRTGAAVGPAAALGEAHLRIGTAGCHCAALERLHLHKPPPLLAGQSVDLSGLLHSGQHCMHYLAVSPAA